MPKGASDFVTRLCFASPTETHSMSCATGRPVILAISTKGESSWGRSVGQTSKVNLIEPAGLSEEQAAIKMVQEHLFGQRGAFSQA
jgi:hypothetical protein